MFDIRICVKLLMAFSFLVYFSQSRSGIDTSLAENVTEERTKEHTHNQTCDIRRKRLPRISLKNQKSTHDIPIRLDVKFCSACNQSAVISISNCGHKFNPQRFTFWWAQMVEMVPIEIWTRHSYSTSIYIYIAKAYLAPFTRSPLFVPDAQTDTRFP